jgi:hypothetical protein
MILNTVQIPFSHKCGEFPVKKLSTVDENFELRRLDSDMIEYDHPVTGRTVRLYDVSDRVFRKIEARYNEAGELYCIAMPSPVKHHLRTVWEKFRDPQDMLMNYGEFCAHEAFRPVAGGGNISRLFVDYYFDETPTFSVILASPEDAVKYSADQSAPYPQELRKRADSEFLTVILAGIEEPAEAFRKFVTYTTNTLSSLLKNMELTTEDFCVVKEEYD